MTIAQAIVLGIVQGLTEFLPVSSTAHLRVVPALLGWDDPGAAYSAVIQLGTLAATIVYFARDLRDMARGFFEGVAARKPFAHPQGRIAVYVVLGTAPIGVAGLLFRRWIEHEARSLYVIAATMVLLAVVLFVAERVGRRERGMDGLGLGASQAIGLAQAFALVPGVSRSGVTLIAGLFCGLTRDAAAKFSFLLSIPAVAAAGVFQLEAMASDPASPGAGPLVAGAVAAFVSGYVAIDGLLRFLRTRSTLVFVVYRIVLGIALAALAARGMVR